MVSTTPGRKSGLLQALARDPYRYAAVSLSLTMALMYVWGSNLGAGSVSGQGLYTTGTCWWIDRWIGLVLVELEVRIARAGLSFGSHKAAGTEQWSQPASVYTHSNHTTGHSAGGGARFMGPCPEGWVLPQIGAAMRERVEEAAGSWYRNQPTLLRKAYNDASEMKNMAGPVREPDGHKRFDVVMPVVDACPKLSKVGSQGDGGKLICGLDEIVDTPDNPCVVYSIGGNNQWDFEADVVRRTSCKVFTFDCTIDGHVPAELQDRVEYHQICLGTNTEGAAEGSKQKFMRLGEIMAMLGHDHITLLKMDIEGYEYSVLYEIFDEKDVLLPEQISFELHYETQMPGLDWWGRQATAGEMALFSRRLYEAGYRLISREDNPLCDHCTELTAVRFQCPTAF